MDNPYIKSNLYANSEENHKNNKLEDTLENLRELYENPNSKTRITQHNQLKKIKMNGNINKKINQNSNFKRIDFNDKSNNSEIFSDYEKKLNKENLNVQKIINLKDYIMKLGKTIYL